MLSFIPFRPVLRVSPWLLMLFCSISCSFGFFPFLNVSIRAAFSSTRPRATDDLLATYGLGPLAATVARTDPVTGEKRKIRKTYKGKIQAFGLAGRNQEVKHPEGAPGGLMEMVLRPQDDWYAAKVHGGHELARGLGDAALAKLERALTFERGPLPGFDAGALALDPATVAMLTGGAGVVAGGAGAGVSAGVGIVGGSIPSAGSSGKRGGSGGGGGGGTTTGKSSTVGTPRPVASASGLTATTGTSAPILSTAAKAGRIAGVVNAAAANLTTITAASSRAATPEAAVAAAAAAASATAARPKRAGKKRRYDDRSFEGYEEAFADDVTAAAAAAAAAADGPDGGKAGRSSAATASGATSVSVSTAASAAAERERDSLRKGGAGGAGGAGVGVNAAASGSVKRRKKVSIQ
jgi:hypothetical protein